MSLYINKFLKLFENISVYHCFNTLSNSTDLLKEEREYEKFTKNKYYHKLIKLQLISAVYIKFINNEFNYDSNMKTHLKRLINSINDANLLLYENVIIKLDAYNTSNSLKEFINLSSDKINNKIVRLHKINKIVRHKEFNNVLSKLIDSISNSIKQFSK